MSANGLGGGFRITVAGVVGVSAKPVRIYGYTMLSGPSGAGSVKLYDGTANTGAERWSGAGNMDSGSIVSFGEHGKFFPSGAYCDIDSNVTYVDFNYEQVNI